MTFKVVDIFGDVQTDHDNLPEIEDHQIMVDHDHCRWVNAPDFGDIVSCQDDELAAGACAGFNFFLIPMEFNSIYESKVEVTMIARMALLSTVFIAAM